MDYRKLVATTTSSDASELIDRLNIHPNTEPQVGTFLVFDGGSNNGNICRVSDQNRSAGKLELIPTTTVPAPSGQVVHQVNLRSNGFTPADIYDAINETLRYSYPEAKDEVALTPVVFSMSDPKIDPIALDGSIEGVTLIEYYSDSYGWEKLPQAYAEGAAGWWASPYDGYIYINGHWIDDLHGLTIRVTGYKPFQLLTNDTDTTSIGTEWLVVETAYRLLRSGILRDPQRFTIAQELSQRKERLAASVRSRATSSTAAIRL